VRITPPYWATWWFRSIVFLILATGAFFAYRYSVKNAAMKAELQTAHNAQMAIMPLSDPDVPGFEISGSCITANDVGGDFYDYIWLDREKTRLGIVVGDVSGKAMEAAMIAIMSNGMVFSKTDELDSVKDIMTHLNRSLFLKTDEIMYTALCLASLEIDRSELTFSLAAFSEPLLKRGAELITLRPPGSVLPLGAFENSTYSDETIELLGGDVLTIYTDGISEAQNKRGEFYDLEGLKRALMRIDTRSVSASKIKDLILADVSRFCGSSNRRDDITLVVIKRI
jgi:sigma-B regulation protein RsbU (phosphoserine phosphatase)